MKQDKYEFNNTFWKHSAAELPRNFIWTKGKKNPIYSFFFLNMKHTCMYWRYFAHAMHNTFGVMLGNMFIFNLNFTLI